MLTEKIIYDMFLVQFEHLYRTNDMTFLKCMSHGPRILAVFQFQER